jgi:hypothetical protein
MRILLFGLTLILSIHFANAQPVVRGVLTKNKFGYHNGDTLLLLGYYPPQSNNSNKFVVKSASGTIRMVSPSLVKVVDTIGDFWDSQWYYHRSGEIARKGWGNNIRNELKRNNSNYLNELKDNGFLVEDSALLEYLNQLALNIGPQKLYKGFDTQICVYVIKADRPDIFSFDNGNIFITTEMLVQTPSEEKLAELLTNQIAHIVCDHQYTCLKIEKRNNTAAAIFIGIVAVAATVAIIADSKNNPPDNHNPPDYNYFPDETFAFATCVSYSPPKVEYAPPKKYLNYTSEQTAEANYITKSYSLQLYNKNYLSQSEYIQNISSAITYTAWNLFFKSKYKESLALINQLDNSNACGSEDYLLKAKLYRKLYNTDEANYEALKYLQLAREASNQTNIDIVKEEGLIYFQLKNMDKAKAAFEEYRYGLQQLGGTGDDDKKELYWVNNMIQKTSSNNLN